MSLTLHDSKSYQCWPSLTNPQCFIQPTVMVKQGYRLDPREMQEIIGYNNKDNWSSFCLYRFVGFVCDVVYKCGFLYMMV